jgi:hypothetical protein
MISVCYSDDLLSYDLTRSTAKTANAQSLRKKYKGDSHQCLLIHQQIFELPTMEYIPLPKGTQLSSSEFIGQMNLAIKDLPEYSTGMIVQTDGNGYWLERDGKLDRNHPGLLSAARKIVLGERIR